MKRIFTKLKTIENNLRVKMSEIVGLIREVVIMGDAKEILVEINKDFGDSLLKKVIPHLIFDTESIILNATICDEGDLKPNFEYLRDYINKNVMSHTNLGDPKKRIKSTISKMKLNKYLDRDFKKLSDGERRWIELAVSIACDTKVLLIDGFGQYLGEDLSLIHI